MYQAQWLEKGILCVNLIFSLYKKNNHGHFIYLLQSIEDLEKEMLNGQKLQGPPTAFEVNYMLKNKKMEDR